MSKRTDGVEFLNARSGVFRAMHVGSIVPGQTLPSFLEHAGLMNGYRSLRAVLIEDMGRWRIPLEGMPAPLTPICEAMPDSLGTAQNVLRENSLFAYWTGGASPHATKRIWCYMMNGGHGPIRPAHLPLLLGQSPFERLHCPECELLHVQQHGFTPTMRMHIAPFITVCPVHGAMLFDVRKQAEFSALCTSSARADERRRSLEYARRTMDLVNRNPDAQVPAVQFRELLGQRGFLTEMQNVRVKSLLALHHAFQSKPFCDVRLTHVCHNEVLLTSAIRRMISGKGSAHPVMLCLLFWTLSEIVAPRERPVKAPSRHPLNAGQVHAALTRYSTASEAARALGVGTTTFLTRATELGYVVRRKPSRLTNKVIDEVTRRFSKGERIEAIAADTCISVSSIYRIVRGNGQLVIYQRRRLAEHVEDARRRWLAMGKTSPGASVSVLRAKAPELYARLYRLDRTWLMSHGARSAKTGGRRGPCESAAELKARARKVIVQTSAASQVTRAPRLTVNSIAERTGLSPYYLSNCDGETAHTLRTAAESKSCFVARRYFEAEKILLLNSGDAPFWKVSKRSGLRRIDFVD